MAVIAANTAESNAQKNHVVLPSIESVSTPRLIGAVIRVGASISRLFHGGDEFCIANLPAIQPTNRNFTLMLKLYAGVSKKVGLPGSLIDELKSDDGTSPGTNRNGRYRSALSFERS